MDSETRGEDRSRQLRRWGPIVAIGAVVLVGLVFVLLLGDEEGERPTTTTTREQGAGPPEGVLSFSMAQEQGTDVEWPETCDTERGVLAAPFFFAPECYAPFEGENQGATESGVTEESITVVVYQTPDDDPILTAISSFVSDDTNEQARETLETMLPYYHQYYETYGREVELIFFEGTGASDDEVAARADAETIVEEYDPFMVWGTPVIAATPFVEELAAQGVPVFSTGGLGTPDFAAENDPYFFSIGIGTVQARQHLAEYIGKRLAERPASHAGPEIEGQERVFGTVYLDTGAEAAETLELFEEYLAAFDVSLAEAISYTDPTTLQADAPEVIARLKASGVTSVVFTGDPLAPRALTAEATAQEYYPEWILTGTALVDTTAFGRIYDQQQWSHAFGPSNQSARTAPQASGFWRLYEWYTCSPPPASETLTLVMAAPNAFFSVLQAAGPDLTHESFRDALFAGDPTPSAITNPSLSWGDHGRWPEPDYFGVDDATEVWWDPDATGLSETGEEGRGMYRYVDGGRRYLPGEWPETDPAVFETEGSVVLYDEPPAEEQAPDYPSPCR